MKRKHSWPAGFFAGLTAVVTLLMAGPHTWAQQQPGSPAANRQLGEVVSVSGNQITILTETGERKSFDVPNDAKVFLDGQKTQLQDLKKGDEVLLSATKDDPNKASSLRAFRERKEEFTARREAREARRASPEARRPALGVVIQETPDQRGVKVLRVRPDSPAAKAGVHPGDILLSINDQSIDSPSKLSDLISEKKPGEKLSLKLNRDGQEMTVEASLVGRREVFRGMEGQRRAAGREEYFENQQEASDPQHTWLGLFIDETQDQEGVEVLRVFPGGPADKAGLRTGDIVLSIADKDVASPSDVVDALKEVQPGQTAKVVILRDDKKQTLEVKAGDRSRFLRDQRRFREGMPFRGGDRFGPGADRFGGPTPWMEQDRFDMEQRERLESLGEEMLQELRALRRDVQELQEQIGDQAPPQR